MVRIGILTCTNTTQDVGCSSFKCLEGVYDSVGEFERHKENGGAQLAGIINCAGCPTAVAPEKILDRVRSLTVLGLDAIHLSSCMMSLCPFKNKYKKLLQQTFPEIEVVEGTHVEPPEVVKMFIDGMKEMLTQPKVTMANMVEKASETESVAV
jgi:predicted metal-binding protein